MNAPLKTTDEAATDFVRRHIGPSPRDVGAMLDSVGAKSLGRVDGPDAAGLIRQKAALDTGPAAGKSRRWRICARWPRETKCSPR